VQFFTLEKGTVTKKTMIINTIYENEAISNKTQPLSQRMGWFLKQFFGFYRIAIAEFHVL